MPHYTLFNDEFFEKETPILKVGNRAFKFGDGLFESMRMANGRLQFPELHADRIKATMKALKMDGYNLLDEYFLKTKSTSLLVKIKFMLMPVLG